MAFAIFFNDTRFDDMDMTGAERTELLLDMLKRGAFDFQDDSISGLSVAEVGGVERKIMLAIAV